MPQLDWREYELLEFFETFLVEEDYGTRHRFEETRNGVRLVLSLEQYVGRIEISLFREGSENSIASFVAFVRGAVRHINDKRGNYLEIEDCLLAPDKTLYLDVPVWDRDVCPFSTTIRVLVRPEIRLMFSTYRDRT
ncbi:MAG: hypothetical protein AB7O26_09535 [Planctomycetaceae bacterium]